VTTERVERPEETTEEEYQAIEWAKIGANFLYFLMTYVKVMEPPPGRGVISFELWGHLIHVIGLLFKHPKIVILKSRQVGLTWLLAAYALWTAMTKPGARVLILSKSKLDAQEVIERVKFIYSQLPKWMQVTITTENKGELEFKSMMSKIKAFASTEDAGRSETGTLVICDEHDFHPHAEANYAALKPTIDAVYADGSQPQIICVSTSNKLEILTQFKTLYREAKAGANSFKNVFIPWWSRPGRDRKWFLQQCKDFAKTPWQREGEYPENEEEALSPPRAIAAFNQDSLKNMLADVRKPLPRIEGEMYSPLINLYKKYVPGRTYTGGIDTGHGVGQDESVCAVMDLQTMEVVADIQSSSVNPRDFARISVQLLKMYETAWGGEPLVGVENNDWGHEVIQYMMDEGYGNFFYMDWFKIGKRDEERKKEIGWHTAPGGTDSGRWVLWGDLVDAVPGLIVYNEKGLQQFFDIIRNPDKNGKIEAIKGCHDDYPMAVGLAWHMRKYTYFGPALNDKASHSKSYMVSTGRIGN